MSFHDEPIVVENHPVRVDFARVAPKTGGGNEWNRQFTGFNEVVILGFNQSGRLATTRTYDVSALSQITVKMKEGANAASLSFGFVPGNTNPTDGQVTMTCSGTNLDTGPNGHLQPPDFPVDTHREWTVDGITSTVGNETTTIFTRTAEYERISIRLTGKPEA